MGKPCGTLAFVPEAMPYNGPRPPASLSLDATFNFSWKQCRGGGVQHALRDTATLNLSPKKTGISKAV